MSALYAGGDFIEKIEIKQECSKTGADDIINYFVKYSIKFDNTLRTLTRLCSHFSYTSIC